MFQYKEYFYPIYYTVNVRKRVVFLQSQRGEMGLAIKAANDTVKTTP
jgi:hypothetical protein